MAKSTKAHDANEVEGRKAKTLGKLAPRATEEAHYNELAEAADLERLSKVTGELIS